MSSGGGGSSAPTQQTITQTTIPEWAKPYATRVLGEAENLAYNRPYQPYTGQRMAALNPLQEQAFLGTQALAPSSNLQQASGLAGLAGISAMEAGQYAPTQAQQFYQGPQLGSVGIGYGTVAAPSLQQFQLGPAERVGADRFSTQAMQDYMSPYMTGVVEQQKQAAVQDYARQMPALQAAGIRAGARGGTREALLQSEAQRNLQQQLGGIEATGRQQAFQQAQQQFGADRAAAMQAALANQAAGLTTGQQNLAALLGVQQLGAQTGLQAGQLNQAAQLQAQQQALAQQQGLNQLAMQGAGQQAQYGLAGAQLGEQSRQFGANLGLQGLQQQLAAAGTLGQLGQTQFGQQMQALQAQQQAGAGLQGMEQQRLEQQYQDFLAAQRYPYAQLGFMSDILRGTPASGAVQTLYQAAPSTLGQVGGAALGLAGLAKAYG